MSRAKDTFETFHKRDIEPVYPFNHYKNALITFDIGLPNIVHVGKAVRVLYDSDKWNDVGDVTGYYHDHGPDDGDHVFSPKNLVKLYAPKKYFPRKKTVKLPVKWPKELVLLGGCDGWVAREATAKPHEVIKADTDDCILVCSPFGWLSKKDEKQVFLAVIEVSTGYLEALIHGPGLRVTAAGITG